MRRARWKAEELAAALAAGRIVPLGEAEWTALSHALVTERPKAYERRWDG